MKTYIIPLFVGLYICDAEPVYAGHRVPVPQSFQRLRDELSHQKSKLEYLTGREVKNWPTVADTVEVDEKEEQRKHDKFTKTIEKLTEGIQLFNGKPVTEPTAQSSIHNHHSRKCTNDNGYWHCDFSGELDKGSSAGKCTNDNGYWHCDFKK